ncbi:hypothetical protein [Streptomyces sp. NPDC001450]
MRTRAISASAGALALVVILAGCNGVGSGSSGAQPSAGSTAARTTFSLGETSPVQDSDMKTSDGAKYTVTVTQVQTGTKADMDNSGLEQDSTDRPTVPVYVWTTLAHKSGPPMRVGDMTKNLLINHTMSLMVIGEPKWPNCPLFDPDTKLRAGQLKKVCQVFLIPAGEQPASVQLFQGFSRDPLRWMVPAKQPAG